MDSTRHALHAIRMKKKVVNYFEPSSHAAFPALIGTGCACLGLGVRFKNEVVERRTFATDSRSMIVRERTGMANAAIKLDTLYSVTRTHAERVKWPSSSAERISYFASNRKLRSTLSDEIREI